MRTIELDSAKWKTLADFYAAVLAGVGAPKWHGDSIAALIDSMVWGRINTIEPPYRIRILGMNKLPTEIRDEIERLVEAVVRHRLDHRRWHGKDVEVEFELVP